ncbi:uncharacterized protein JCM6883_004421 [Sporobolomyces salmoneus]|uniref:uncharacterized protein n=1 Tax=Sporobolomyces salmoneus TaxID=183962 RepID=UPI0031721C30
MCRAEATVVYGLTVRSASLVFAADAWIRLQHSFQFFDLVFLRRRNGGLVSSTGIGDGPVTRVPNEVWEEIRHWLVKEELAEAQDNLLGPLFCDDPTCGVRPPPWKSVTWSSYLEIEFEECHRCEDSSQQFFSNVLQRWEDPHCSRLKGLLSSFGLALPLTQGINVAVDWENEDALALISAPMDFRDGQTEDPYAIAESGGNLYPDEHTSIEISFKQLPSDIDRRFERFISLFDLEVVESSINKLSPKSSKSTKDENGTSEAQRSGVRDKVTKRIRPSWRLELTCLTTSW